MIGLPLKTDPEFLEPPGAADQPAQHDHGRAQMSHVRADPAHDSLGGVERHLVRLVLRQHAIALLRQHADHPFSHGLFGALQGDLGLVLHALDEGQGDVHLILLHRAPDGRKPFVEAGQGVNAEEGQQAGEPPGVIDIGEAEAKKPTIRLFAIFLNIDLGTVTLLDDGPNGGRHRQHDEQEHGEFDGGEKLAKLSRHLIPPQPGGRPRRRVPVNDRFGLSVHQSDP